MEHHIETIICPECRMKQSAKVGHTFPFNTYIHECVKCNYIIMESEWNSVKVKINKHGKLIQYE